MPIRFILAALLAGGIATAHAGPPRDAFEAAAASKPELRTREAQRAAIDAWPRGADAMTPGAPGGGLGTTTDRFTRTHGLGEAEREVGVPVWLPGQSRAQRGPADAEGQRLGLGVARADIRIAEVEDRESPEIATFMRQERDDRDSGWDTRLGVRVRIPLAQGDPPPGGGQDLRWIGHRDVARHRPHAAPVASLRQAGACQPDGSAAGDEGCQGPLNR